MLETPKIVLFDHSHYVPHKSPYGVAYWRELLASYRQDSLHMHPSSLFPHIEVYIFELAISTYGHSQNSISPLCCSCHMPQLLSPSETFPSLSEAQSRRMSSVVYKLENKITTKIRTVKLAVNGHPWDQAYLSVYRRCPMLGRGRDRMWQSCLQINVLDSCV